MPSRGLNFCDPRFVRRSGEPGIAVSSRRSVSNSVFLTQVESVQHPGNEYPEPEFADQERKNAVHSELSGLAGPIAQAMHGLI